MWTSLSLTVLIVMLLSFPSGDSSKIVVVPVDGSHWLNMEIILRKLHSRGHEITVLRSPKSWYIPENSTIYSSINVHMLEDEEDLEAYNRLLLDVIKCREKSSFIRSFCQQYEITKLLSKGHKILADSTAALLDNPVFMKKMHDAQFDLMLTDPAFSVGVILGSYLKLPMVFNVRWINNGESHFAMAPSPPSYVPVSGTELTDKLDFMERVKNVLFYFYYQLELQFLINPPYNDLMSRHFPPGTDLLSLELSADIWLVRADFIFEFPRPTMPNVVYIGGFQCQEPSPLSGDLQSFVESSGDHGVVIMSLGTFVSALPRKTTEAIAAAFAELPQKVIWRYIGQPPTSLGNNTLLVKWLPQKDLLGHPKTRAFVAHGGTNGMYEAIYHGVPVVGLPLLFDQFDNVLRLKARGAARIVEAKSITKDSFLEAVKDVIENPSYRENIQRLSRLHRDTPISPMDAALFWIEYVIRNKGAQHLQSAGYRLPWMWTSLSLTVLTVVLLCFPGGDSSKIVVVPVDGSHWLNMEIILRKLHSRGHEITVLRSPKSWYIPENSTVYTSINIHSLEDEEDMEVYNRMLLDVIECRKKSIFIRSFCQQYQITKLLRKGHKILADSAAALLDNPVFMKKMYDMQFDLMLTDPGMPVGVILGSYLKLPMVFNVRWINNGESHFAMAPSPPSYVPVSGTELTDKMDFMESVKNVLFYFYSQIELEFLIYPAYNDLMSRHFPPGTDLLSLELSADIWLVRADFVFEFPRPTMPNVVYIGGFQSQEPSPLSGDLQTFVESSGDHGVVIMSLGTIVSALPRETTEAIAAAFAELPQKVIWRYIGQPPTSLGNNTLLVKWLPQKDLLGHPKTRAFVAHGGTNGMYEAIYHGVPVVGLPLLFDQFDNVIRLKARGAARIVEAKSITKDSFLEAVKDVIENPSYRENIQRLSRLHRDTPISPMDAALFWIEYVIRNKGARHLQSAGYQLPWMWISLSLTVLTVVLLGFPGSDSSKIVVVPLDGSHWLNIEIILRKLHSRGHEITVLRSQKSWYIPENSTIYTSINIHSIEDEGDLEAYNRMLLDVIKCREKTSFIRSFCQRYKITRLLRKGHKILADSAAALLDNPVFMKKMHDGQFDLMLTDPAFPVGVILGSYLKLPMVFNVRWINNGDSHFAMAPSPSSYVPISGTELTDKMEFEERVKNVLYYFYSQIELQFFINPAYYDLMSRHFSPGTDLLSLELSADIWLVRADFVFEFPRPTMPNVVYIGGLQCHEPSPLSGDLQSFVESSGDDGVVIMSLGTLVSALPRKTTEAIAEAFAELPQKVIWKYIGQPPTSLGNNTLLVKWLPQKDLLGHPKTRAFVAHGGTNGMYEAIYHGVPVVGLPLLFDQFDNVLRLKARGAARVVEPSFITKDSFLEAVKDVIENPSYRENIQRLSRLHRDTPISPMDAALFWIEYVIRNKGAQHLQSAGYWLPWMWAFFSFSLTILSVLLSFPGGDSGRILVVPVDGSHWLNMEIILRKLHAKGHELTVLHSPKSWFISKNSTMYTSILIRTLGVEDDMEGYNRILKDMMECRKKSPFILTICQQYEVTKMVRSYHAILANDIAALLDDPVFMKKLHDMKFDLMLTDPAFPVGVILGGYLKLPMVFNVRWLSNGESQLTIAPSPPSFVPFSGTELSDKMNFVERVKNVLFCFYSQIELQFRVYPAYVDLITRHFPPGTDLLSLELSAAIWLVRSDFIFEFPRPTMPNVVYIEITEAIAAAFAELPQKVIWRYMGQPPTSLGNNTLLVKWLPQKDLLGHPKTRAFVAHGGTNGLYEAIYHGVPVVGFPLLFDQFDNVIRLKARGAARVVEPSLITKDSFLEVIMDVIENPSYRENIQRLSRLHRDTPISPMDAALFWIEYVIRNKGAQHLQSAGYREPWAMLGSGLGSEDECVDQLMGPSSAAVQSVALCQQRVALLCRGQEGGAGLRMLPLKLKKWTSCGGNDRRADKEQSRRSVPSLRRREQLQPHVGHFHSWILRWR
ncbi:hypothetical protein WMY93_017281 [Mugilogobius chulae]|uniref:UDP-glucuronosyltransferase n=1 Tax=Mugilogobius chulae TaxID=88201 RepID=A0AAW0NU61_9GOBI